MNTFTKILGEAYTEDFFTNPNPKLQSQLNEQGVVVLPDFVSKDALTKLQNEARELKPTAYRSESVYNLFVKPDDAAFSENSPRNRKFKTTKGCAPDDQIPQDSILRTIYESKLFRSFICTLQNLPEIYPYGDTLSSININYYDKGDSLEWHFDNADFAITLLVKQCDAGGVYEYFPNIRYTAEGKEDYEALAGAIDRKMEPEVARMEAGALMIFRGNRSLHRVTPIEKGERVLVTLNYNEKPNIPLSENSRKTFFGRTK